MIPWRLLLVLACAVAIVVFRGPWEPAAYWRVDHPGQPPIPYVTDPNEPVTRVYYTRVKPAQGKDGLWRFRDIEGIDQALGGKIIVRRMVWNDSAVSE